MGCAVKKCTMESTLEIPAAQSIRASYDGKVVYAGDDIEIRSHRDFVARYNHFFTIYAYLGEILIQQDASREDRKCHCKTSPNITELLSF
ncbi:MAG: hypothetical protein R2877_07775 [Bdellovibrionota bacterium]